MVTSHQHLPPSARSQNPPPGWWQASHFLVTSHSGFLPSLRKLQSREGFCLRGNVSKCSLGSLSELTPSASPTTLTPPGPLLYTLAMGTKGIQVHSIPVPVLSCPNSKEAGPEGMLQQVPLPIPRADAHPPHLLSGCHLLWLPSPQLPTDLVAEPWPSAWPDSCHWSWSLTFPLLSHCGSPSCPSSPVVCFCGANSIGPFLFTGLAETGLMFGVSVSFCRRLEWVRCLPGAGVGTEVANPGLWWGQQPVAPKVEAALRRNPLGHSHLLGLPLALWPTHPADGVWPPSPSLCPPPTWPGSAVGLPPPRGDAQGGQAKKFGWFVGAPCACWSQTFIGALF